MQGTGWIGANLLYVSFALLETVFLPMFGCNLENES